MAPMSTPIQSPVASLLLEIYEQRRKKNSRYSMRGFARDLGTSVSSLSRILQGKRQPSRQLAAQWLASLEVEQSRAQALLAGLRNHRAAPREGELTPSTKILEDWIATAVTEWTKCRKLTELDAKQIAKDLRVSRSRVETVIAALCEAELLIFKKGRWIFNGKAQRFYKHTPKQMSRLFRGISSRFFWSVETHGRPSVLSRYAVLAVEEKDLAKFKTKLDKVLIQLFQEFDSPHPDRLMAMTIGGFIVDDPELPIEP